MFSFSIVLSNECLLSAMCIMRQMCVNRVFVTSVDDRLVQCHRILQCLYGLLSVGDDEGWKE